MLPADQLLALSVFSSYFTVIILLFILILRSIQWRQPRRKGRHAVVYGSLAVVSLAHTWYYMIRFLLWSKHDFESQITRSRAREASSLARLADWLVQTRLFEQAWFAVCEGPWNWLWSEQLCLFTAGAWTVFLYVESRRSRVALPWAYMLLGQLVAISVASNLFYLALALSPRIAGRDRAHMRLPAFLWMCVAAALVSVYTSPALLHSRFLSNLLVMHGAITLPLLPLPKTLRSAGMVSASAVYWSIACAALAIRMGTLRNVFSTGMPLSRIPKDAWTTLHSHPAQSSIGWDIVWTTLSFAAYELLERGAAWSACLAPVISVGVVAPATLATAEPRSSSQRSR
ncbi:hypothetical protein AURDEDRAFT_140727 [Auricularia subglabra TFB-10046 SS5]|nr:hypothetical protein AURDEDRAFT_140727 [Auricularia subglabra TFB-10046 SS5]